VADKAIAVRHALVVEDLTYLVWLVTVHTGGKDVHFLFPQLTLDDLAVHILDLGVASGARRRDVLSGDRGTRIRMGQDVVRRVTRRARGRDDEAFLQQPLAVNALGIVLQNVVLVDLTLELDGGTFTMTSPTEQRYPERRQAGGRIVGGEDIVIAVAVLAVRSQLVSSYESLPVKRSLVFLRLDVAVFTVDLLEGLLVGQLPVLQIRVTGHTGKLGVDRAGEPLLINVQGDGLLAPLGGHRLVFVTHQTIAVLDLLLVFFLLLGGCNVW
jgi:hypothetical protein